MNTNNLYYMLMGMNPPGQSSSSWPMSLSGAIPPTPAMSLTGAMPPPAGQSGLMDILRRYKGMYQSQPEAPGPGHRYL